MKTENCLSPVALATREYRTITYCILCLSFVIVSGCSPKFLVDTMADSDYDVRLYSTYTWLVVEKLEANNNPLYYNEMSDKYIKAAVNRNLSDRNFNLSMDSGQLVIHYHIVEKNITVSREDPFFYHNAPWLGTEKVYDDYMEGTLIIDIMERKSNALLWRGLASGVFNSAEPYLSKKQIDGAISQIFKGFPTSFF